MKRLWRASVVVVATLLLASCAGAISDTYVIEDDPGHVKDIGGGLALVSLTDPAAERLQIETTPVGGSGRNLVVPMTAVFVDTDGVWWVYTERGNNEFVRHEVEIKEQQDGSALLSSGPDAGTEVVTVGVAELYGIEDEVGH